MAAKCHLQQLRALCRCVHTLSLWSMWKGELIWGERKNSIWEKPAMKAKICCPQPLVWGFVNSQCYWSVAASIQWAIENLVLKRKKKLHYPDTFFHESKYSIQGSELPRDVWQINRPQDALLVPGCCPFTPSPSLSVLGALAAPLLCWQQLNHHPGPCVPQ